MTFTERSVHFPDEVAVDPDKATRSIWVDPDQGIFAPRDLLASFAELDKRWKADPLGHLQFMANSVHRLHDQKLDLAYMHNERDANSEDLMIVMSPLNDSRPTSTAAELHKLITTENPSRLAIEKVRPNSWNPLTKLAIDYEFSHAEGYGMPRMQVLAREVPALTHEELKQIRSGDMTPYARLADIALKKANRLKYETYGTEGYKRVHFFNAGMGIKALGAVAGLSKLYGDQLSFGAVTTMNFSIGDESFAALANKYTHRATTGEASNLVIPQHFTMIREPAMRRAIDSSTEFSMYGRIGMAAKDWRIVKAIMQATAGPAYVEQALNAGATYTYANSLNEAMVTDTAQHLTGIDKINAVQIVGIEGKKPAMLANEHAALVAVINAVGLRNHLDVQR